MGSEGTEMGWDSETAGNARRPAWVRLLWSFVGGVLAAALLTLAVFVVLGGVTTGPNDPDLATAPVAHSLARAGDLFGVAAIAAGVVAGATVGIRAMRGATRV
jgi:O-antigen ligase